MENTLRARNVRSNLFMSVASNPRELPNLDPLTGLHTGRYLREAWEVESRAAMRGGGAVSVLVVRIEGAEDAAAAPVDEADLVEVATLLRGLIRVSDVAARYRHDVLVVMMSGADPEDAAGLRRRFTRAVEERNARIGASLPPLRAKAVVLGGTGRNVAGLLDGVDRLCGRDPEVAPPRPHPATAARHHGVALQAVLSLARIEELREPQLAGHAERVRRHAVRVGSALGLTGEALRAIEYAALLHDVGKVALPLDVVLKAGPLTPEERAVMRRHPEYGENIVEQVEPLQPVAYLIRSHHERFDGHTDGPFPGYPDGLRGDAIPLGSRIIAVVDAYDAMTSDRSYRPALTADVAARELLRGAGGQFDPVVVQAFIATRPAPG